MKKIALVTAALIAVAGSQTVFAASQSGNLTAGTFGINVSTQASLISTAVVGAVEPNFTITGKYAIAHDVVLLAGLGIGFIGGNAPAGGTSPSGTDYAFLVGGRKYFSSGDFSPYFGGRFEYARITPLGGATTDSVFSLGAEAGAEYFLNKHFSLEGGIGFRYTSVDPGNNGTKISFFGTTNYGLSANFYF